MMNSKTKSTALAFIMILMMLVFFIPISATATSAEEPDYTGYEVYYVNSEDLYKAAISAINTSNKENHLIVITGDFSISTQFAYLTYADSNEVFSANNTVIISEGNHTITLSGNYSYMVSVTGTATVSIGDTNTVNNTLTLDGGSANYRYALCISGEKATLNMYDGVTVTGCKAFMNTTTNYTPIIYVSSGATFNIYGGIITSNTIAHSRVGYGLIYVEYAYFNMSGGTITNVTDSRTSTKYGTAITAIGSSVDIEEGAIIDTSTNTEGAIYFKDTANSYVTDISLTINNPTITGCDSALGGALYIDVSSDDTTITITDTTFENCSAGTNGGAIYITCSSSADIAITGCTFTNNESSYGGAIYIKNTGSAAITIDKCTFSKNEVSSNGGAIYISNTGTAETIEITNCKFTTNDASTYGGAIYVSNSGAAEAIEISGCEFTENDAGTSGGAVYMSNSKETAVNITRCTFTGNTTTATTDTTTYGGGAVYMNNTSTGNFTIDDCEFAENESHNGGAIYMAGAGTGTITISKSGFTENEGDYGGTIFLNSSLSAAVAVNVSNCTFTENEATSYGGAIYTMSKAPLNIDDSTFDGNTADYGGAVAYYNASNALTITDSSFTGNEAIGGGALFVYNSSESLDTTNVYLLGETSITGNYTDDSDSPGAVFLSYQIHSLNIEDTVTVSGNYGVLSDGNTVDMDIFVEYNDTVSYSTDHTINFYLTDDFDSVHEATVGFFYPSSSTMELTEPHYDVHVYNADDTEYGNTDDEIVQLVLNTYMFSDHEDYYLIDSSLAVDPDYDGDDDDTYKELHTYPDTIYYSNDGSEQYQEDETQYKYYEITTILGNIFELEGKVISSWNTQADGSGDTYQIGEEVFRTTDDLLLYAIWETVSASTEPQSSGDETTSGSDDETTSGSDDETTSGSDDETVSDSDDETTSDSDDETVSDSDNEFTLGNDDVSDSDIVTTTPATGDSGTMIYLPILLLSMIACVWLARNKAKLLS